MMGRVTYPPAGRDTVSQARGSPSRSLRRDAASNRGLLIR
jgi:hypothetical protein